MLCDKCHVNAGYLYCLECKNHLCLPCENTNHTNTHTTVPAQNSYKCDEHDKSVDLYCNTCRKCVCSLCCERHSAYSHEILPVLDVYRRINSEFMNKLNRSGYEKRVVLDNCISNYEKKIESIVREKEEILRDIDDNYKGMMQRLDAAVRPIQNQLISEKEMLSKDLNALENAIKMIQDEDRISFLKQFREIHNTLNVISSRNPLIETEVNFSQIPRELEDMRQIARAYKKLQALNESKNDLIFDICSGKLQADCDGSVKREILQWSRLTDKYVSKLNDFKLQCYFCRLKLDPININTECRMNSRDSMLRGDFSRDTTVPFKFLGTNSHYFIHSSKISKPLSTTSSSSRVPGVSTHIS